MLSKKLKRLYLSSFQVWAIAKREVKEKSSTPYFYIFTFLFPLTIVLLGLFFSGYEPQKARTKVALFLDEQFFFEYEIGMQKSIKEIESNLDVNFEIIDAANSNWDHKQKDLLYNGFVDISIKIVRSQNAYEIFSFVKDDANIVKAKIISKILLFNSLNRYSINYYEVNISDKDFESRDYSMKKFNFNFASSYFLSIFFTTLVLSAGSMISRSFLYEKNYRLLDVLNSSVSPPQIIWGKTLGNFIIGYLHSIIMTLIMATLFYFLKVETPVIVIARQLTFFLLGYLFYAILFVAASIAIETEQGAYQFSALIALILILSFSLVGYISNYAFGKVFLIFFPFINPLYLITISGLGNISSDEIKAGIISLIFWITICFILANMLYNYKILGNKDNFSVLNYFKRKN